MQSFKLFIRTVLPGCVVSFLSIHSANAAIITWDDSANGDLAENVFHSVLHVAKLSDTLLARSRI